MRAAQLFLLIIFYGQHQEVETFACKMMDVEYSGVGFNRTYAAIPLWISPAYKPSQRTRLNDYLRDIQEQVGIRFTHFVRESDRAYITIKKSTVGCYAVTGGGYYSEKIINHGDNCFNKPFYFYRSMYMAMGINLKEIDLERTTSENCDDIIFSFWRDKFVRARYDYPLKYLWGRWIRFTYDHDFVTKIETVNNSKDDQTIFFYGGTDFHSLQPELDPEEGAQHWYDPYDKLMETAELDRAIHGKYFGQYYYSDFFKFHNSTGRMKPLDLIYLKRTFTNTNKILPIFDIENIPTYRPKDYLNNATSPGFFGDIKADAFCGANEVYCPEPARNCLLYQEFRYIVCPAVCGMCETSLRLYYLISHHNTISEQEILENELPICEDNLNNAIAGTCVPEYNDKCIYQNHSNACRRTCGECEEQSRISCEWIKKMRSDMVYDNPNYHFRCQLLQLLVNAGVNPVTDCPYSWGRRQCEQEKKLGDRGKASTPYPSYYVFKKALFHR